MTRDRPQPPHRGRLRWCARPAPAGRGSSGWWWKRSAHPGNQVAVDADAHRTADSPHSRPASRKMRSSPSSSACRLISEEPAETSPAPCSCGRQNGGRGAQVLDTRIGAGPMKTRSTAMSVSLRRARCPCSREPRADTSRVSFRLRVGSGTLARSATHPRGGAPVTIGAILAASSVTSRSNAASQSLASADQSSRHGRVARLRHIGPPLRYAKVVASARPCRSALPPRRQLHASDGLDRQRADCGACEFDRATVAPSAPM